MKAFIELENLCQELGLEAEDLDDLVHDIASEAASDVNNNGLESQIEFLFARLGTDTEQEIRRVASKKT